MDRGHRFQMTDWNRPEKAFHAEVENLAKWLGWRVYHTHDSRQSAPGFPDLVLVKPPRCLFAELKTGNGVTTEAQREWLEKLRACEQYAAVWRTNEPPKREQWRGDHVIGLEGIGVVLR